MGNALAHDAADGRASHRTRTIRGMSRPERGSRTGSAVLHPTSGWKSRRGNRPVEPRSRPQAMGKRSALVLAVSLALALGACGAPDRSSLTPFGGGWYFHRRSHLPEAGWVPTDLYRDWKGRPVLVARNIEQRQFYAPDCVIFVTGHADPPYITYAACGDRRPVAIDVRDYRHWKLEPEGLRYETTLRSAEGVPVRWTE